MGYGPAAIGGRHPVSEMPWPPALSLCVRPCPSSRILFSTVRPVPKRQPTFAASFAQDRARQPSWIRRPGHGSESQRKAGSNPGIRAYSQRDGTRHLWGGLTVLAPSRFTTNRAHRGRYPQNAPSRPPSPAQWSKTPIRPESRSKMAHWLGCGRNNGSRTLHCSAPGRCPFHPGA
jgi:hypothetical protein